MKKITTNDNRTEIITSHALIAEIGCIKFVQDEKYPWVDIYSTSNDGDVFVEQIETDDPIIDELDMKAFAYNWYKDNVEIIGR